ncbi:nicotinamidase-like [Ornithodoros turicata]|uniref:nicotinamidase-like n=1 Tax=Ornithodoros turicata TaxID=34597 RepID=UPI00313870CC
MSVVMSQRDEFNRNVEECFQQNKKPGEPVLEEEEFSRFLARLFTDYDETKTIAGVSAKTHLFKQFDLDHDGKINFTEFENMWTKWVAPVLYPKSAILVVDVQNDFISGTLALKNYPAQEEPEKIVPVINDLTEKLPWTMVVYTYDWHPEDHVSFHDNRMKRAVHQSSKVRAEEAKVMDVIRYVAPTLESGYYEQVLWPRHCVQGTWGAELHGDLVVKTGSHKIFKGVNSELDSYSAFWDNSKLASTTLDADLRAAGVTDVYVCGLATDVCVGSTAFHALELGYRTVLVEDASCGVAPEGIRDTKSRLLDQHAVITTSDKVPGMVDATTRPFAAGLKLASCLAA